MVLQGKETLSETALDDRMTHPPRLRKYRGGGLTGGIFRCGKFWYFKYVRNFPLNFQATVRNNPKVARPAEPAQLAEQASQHLWGFQLSPLWLGIVHGPSA